MSTKIINQIEELHKSLQSINDNDEFIEIFNVFNKHQFEFLNHYYHSTINEQFIERNIVLNKGDYFTVIHNDEIECFKFIKGSGYFKNSYEMKKALEEGFFIEAQKFLKSGKLPKKGINWTHEKLVVKIIRNAEHLNIKTIYNNLQLTIDDMNNIKENNIPIIIDCEKY